MLNVTKRLGLAMTCGLAALMIALPSGAMTIDFEPVVGTIEGTDTVVFSFDVLDETQFRMTLVDLETPAPFQLFGLQLVDEATGFALGDIVGTGMLSLNFSVDPGQYLAVVGGITDSGTNIGTFGLEISDVPIPPVGILFMSALASLGFVRRA